MALKEELLARIKKKKELSGLPDSFILPILEKHISQLKTQELKKSDKKIIVKLVRADLRRHTGMFEKAPLIKKRVFLLGHNKIEDILKTHTSTKERLAFYPELKKLISSLNPKSVLDLGCGLNPLALASPDIAYYAVDIQKDDLNLIEEFFKKNNIRGRIILEDLSQPSAPNRLPPADLCLMLKLLDILEKKGHKQAENLLKNLKCRHFIISFSTKTLSGKPMLHQKRPWLERILQNLKFKFYAIKSENEIFYIVEK